MNLNNKSFKDKLIDLTKKLDDIENGEEGERKQPTLTPEVQELQDRERYQEIKKKYELHDPEVFHFFPNSTSDKTDSFRYVGPKCTAEQCVIECPFFPDTGKVFETVTGGIGFFYDDVDLDENFYGTNNAIEHRQKIATMSPKR